MIGKALVEKPTVEKMLGEEIGSPHFPPSCPASQQPALPEEPPCTKDPPIPNPAQFSVYKHKMPSSQDFMIPES